MKNGPDAKERPARFVPRGIPERRAARSLLCAKREFTPRTRDGGGRLPHAPCGLANAGI